MKTITAYECEICGNISTSKSGTLQHEEMCKWAAKGHDVWVENGDVKHAPRIPAEVFGPHSYAEDGTSDCGYGCGCWMGSSSSGGPVNPFGCCPHNPIQYVNFKIPKETV